MQPYQQDDPYLEQLLSMLGNGKQQPVAPAVMQIAPPQYTNLSSQAGPGAAQAPQGSQLGSIIGSLGSIAGGLVGNGSAAGAGLPPGGIGGIGATGGAPAGGAPAGGIGAAPGGAVALAQAPPGNQIMTNPPQMSQQQGGPMGPPYQPEQPPFHSLSGPHMNSDFGKTPGYDDGNNWPPAGAKSLTGGGGGGYNGGGQKPPPGSFDKNGVYKGPPGGIVDPHPPWKPGPQPWETSLLGRLFYKHPLRSGGGDPGPALKARGFGHVWDAPAPQKSLEGPPPSLPGVSKTSPLGMSSIKDPTIEGLAQSIMPASPRAGRFEHPDMGVGTSPRAAMYEDPELNLGHGYGGY